MSRKDVELFNLSFLDILAGALGAVLFLFIVVPKGTGKAPNASPQLSVKFDTTQMTFFGELPDSMLQYTVGDSLLSLVVNFDEMPSIKNCPEPKPCPKCPDGKKLNRKIASLQSALAKRDVRIANLIKELEKKGRKAPVAKAEPKNTPKKKTYASSSKTKVASKYKGDLPSVPCKFSVEVKWDDIAHNVDLFVCKDGKCVYGGKRKQKTIGFWDSGKSKTSLFGGDLRTTQEAVRQFDSIIEGEYEIFLQYKAAKEEPLGAVDVSGLIYTKTQENGEQGKTFNVSVPFDKKQRTFIGTMKVTKDGKFTFNKSFS